MVGIYFQNSNSIYFYRVLFSLYGCTNELVDLEFGIHVIRCEYSQQKYQIYISKYFLTESYTHVYSR